jgi:hypothetical protein
MTLKTFEIVDGDVVLAGTGRPRQLVNLTKARQDMRRMLSIEALPNGEGAGLDAELGNVPNSQFSFSAKIQARVRRAFGVHVSLQQRYQRTNRSAEEQLARIARMYVVPASGQTFGSEGQVLRVPSKTSFLLRVDALTAAGTDVSLATTLAV